MTRRAAAIREVFATLAQEDLIDDASLPDLEGELGRLESVQPWYVRTMVGFGAWLASLLLIVFVVGVSSFATESPFIVLGLLAIGSAVILRWRVDTDFSNQAALAASLAGQGLVVFAIAELSRDFAQSAFITLATLNAFMLGIYPDKTHRFLSVLLIIVSVTSLFYVWELQSLVPAIGPLLAGAWVVMIEREAQLSGSGFGRILGPVREGLLIGAFGCLLLSTIYVLPELARETSFYPRPWISTLLLGGLLLHSVHRIVPGVFPAAAAPAHAVILVLTMIVLISTRSAPGIALALLVTAHASLHGHAWGRGAGIAFLAIFLASYFYGIEIAMLTKSATLIGTGIMLLSCRWLLLRAARGDTDA